jgi:hypothetical protein
MFNRLIEIHDSTLVSLLIRGDEAVLRFEFYIHQSAGKPLQDPGTGWSQSGILRIKDPVMNGSLSDFPRDLHDGQITLDGTISKNVIPIPLSYQGSVELKLQSWGDAISITGSEVQLELLGEPTYIEELNS